MKVVSRLKAVAVAGLVLAILAGFVGSYTWLVLRQNRQVEMVIQNDLSGAVEDMLEVARIDNAVQVVQFSEEVIAQSARNYAVTGDQLWKTRYEQVQPRFSDALEEIRQVSDGKGDTELAAVYRGGHRLLSMHANVLNLLQRGQRTDAVQVLDGQQYASEKTAFERGISVYVNHRNGVVNGMLTDYQDATAQVMGATGEVVYLSGVLVLVASVLTFLGTSIIVRSRVFAWRRFATGVHTMVGGGLRKRIPIPAEGSVAAVAEEVNALADAAVSLRRESRAVMEAAHEPLVVVNEDGIIRSVNVAALKIFDLPQEELVGKSLDWVGVFAEPEAVTTHQPQEVYDRKAI